MPDAVTVVRSNKVISNKEYPDIFGSFSPKGAYYVSLGHRPGLAYNHILSPEGATQLGQWNRYNKRYEWDLGRPFRAEN
jgi:hypothetical protein